MSEGLDIRSLSVAAASMSHKTAMLERHVDIARLFAGYTWDTLPTRYLASYIPNEKLQNIDAVARKRAGKLWPDVTRTGKAEPNE